jgi:DNA-binding CsgD family transcriptional regulator
VSSIAVTHRSGDFSERSFLRFIDLIYEAAEDPARWRPLYEQLQQATGVAAVHVVALDRRNGSLSYSDGANLPVHGELAYMQRWRHIDPRLPPILERPVGEWTHCHEILDDEAVARHPFYQEFLLAYDRRYTSGCKLVEVPEATIVFATQTSAQQGPLCGPALDFIDRLLPHLRRACRIGLQNFVYSTQALVGHLLVSKLRHPVILTTVGGDVIHTNEAAQALLRSTELVRVNEGKLQLPARYLSDFLKRCAALEIAAKASQMDEATTSAAQASDFQALHIRWNGTRGTTSEALYAFFSLLAPQNVMGAFGLRPVVMLLFYHPGSAPSIDSSLLYAVFGLSPAECRIAASLAEGLSLKEIAIEQGTQHDTVRKQLSSIYQKTATNRQADLVRLLLHLPHNSPQP